VQKLASSVVFLLESSELERLVNDNDEQTTHDLIELAKEKSYILGSVDVNEHLVKRWSFKYHSNLLIAQPHVAAIPDFKQYFVSNIVVTETIISLFALFCPRGRNFRIKVELYFSPSLFGNGYFLLVTVLTKFEKSFI